MPADDSISIIEDLLTRCLRHQKSRDSLKQEGKKGWRRGGGEEGGGGGGGGRGGGGLVIKDDRLINVFFRLGEYGGSPLAPSSPSDAFIMRGKKEKDDNLVLKQKQVKIEL